MKTLGLIGGLGPETTVAYYRLLVSGYRQRTGDHNPSIIINSVDLQRLITWMNDGKLVNVTDYLSLEIERLYKAGADFAALASNTPHIVFDELKQRSPVPLISIVESACEKVQSLQLRKVALIGTRYTMKAAFYQDVFSRIGLRLLTPTDSDQQFIHDKYMNELLNNQFLPETRSQILSIVDRLKESEGIEAVILGGTELPLLLTSENHNGILLLDTSKIHVEALLRHLLN